MEQKIRALARFIYANFGPLVVSFFILASLLFGSTSFAGGAQFAPDCQLSGKGQIFILDHVTDSYQPDAKNSYDLSALRFPLGNGKYLFRETKTYSDGRPQEVTMFFQSMAMGLGHYSASDGSLNSVVMCTRPGHCVGTLTIRAESFTGNFSTDFEANGIRTVTFGSDGSFVDEVLETSTPCPYVR